MKLVRKAAVTGADCTAEAMRQINPDVVAAYPITPQSPIMHTFAQMVADGKVDTIFVDVESEHSAMSLCIGSQAAGARTMTATSANGLAYMWEVVFIAASMRLPIVMTIANRAVGGPINIHCDHSDVMGIRDASWVQFFSETGQEAYENTLMAQRVAEHADVLLPALVCYDGFITSHAVENVAFLEDAEAKRFIGSYTPKNPLLDTDHPVSYGSTDLFDYFFEHKRQQVQAMENAKRVIQWVFDEFGYITGKQFGFVEGYRLDDAERVIFTVNSSAGTVRMVVDELRERGEKVGLLKMRVYRPFPAEHIVNSLKHVKKVAVLERSQSIGAVGGPFFTEVRNAFYEQTQRPIISEYVFGLGGRDLKPEHVHQVFEELKEDQPPGIAQVRYLGVRD